VIEIYELSKRIQLFQPGMRFCTMRALPGLRRCIRAKANAKAYTIKYSTAAALFYSAALLLKFSGALL
jgi:hypothetical protein